ncbi:hypothetical protein MLD38_026767 [Melastoma candidum]|uniref:Uncharacterized protein n=1 Tax=Melastoma candidum TaxID=119954 RepID=A0ACB9P5Y5_9MYRT|nr:hypothetical protein MLD38_026767 [Melastoma candidum]
MDVEEYGDEELMSSLVLAGIDAKQGGDLLSGEDVAWVDSCLVHEPDFSGNNWDAVKDALLDLIGSELNLTSSTTIEGDGPESEMDTGGSPSLELVATSKRPARRGSPLILAESEEVGELTSPEEPSSPMIFKNVFQPNYKEFLESTFDRDEDLTLDVHEVGLSHEDIFKVWDLNVPEEDGEFLSQLRNALAQPSSGQPQQSLLDSDDSNNLQEPEGGLVNLNDLVSGIADLSLKEMSS